MGRYTSLKQALKSMNNRSLFIPGGIMCSTDIDMVERFIICIIHDITYSYGKFYCTEDYLKELARIIGGSITPRRVKKIITSLEDRGWLLTGLTVNGDYFLCLDPEKEILWFTTNPEAYIAMVKASNEQRKKEALA